MEFDERRLILRDEVLFICGISSSALYELIARSVFPKPVRIGRRAVAWHLSEVIDRIASRPPVSKTERK